MGMRAHRQIRRFAYRCSTTGYGQRAAESQSRVRRGYLLAAHTKVDGRHAAYHCVGCHLLLGGCKTRSHCCASRLPHAWPVFPRAGMPLFVVMCTSVHTDRPPNGARIEAGVFFVYALYDSQVTYTEEIREQEADVLLTAY